MFITLIDIADKPDMKELKKEIKMLEMSLTGSDEKSKIALVKTIECKKLEYHEKIKDYFTALEPDAFNRIT